MFWTLATFCNNHFCCSTMKTSTREALKDIVETYNRCMSVMEHDAARAAQEDGRAYGGFVRAAKGKMQEYITERLIKISWCSELNMESSRLEINSSKIKIPIKLDYVKQLKSKSVKDYILKNIRKYYYGLSVDKHIFVDGVFIFGIECKAYSENAMIKRILVDFQLLKIRFPNLGCYLFQLESQLGGDYCTIVTLPKGSMPTHTIMSYFPNVELNIVTLLPGERKVNRPINKPDFFKPLTVSSLEIALSNIVEGFGKYTK